MYRAYCLQAAQNAGDRLQTMVLAVSPVYAEYLDDVVEDLVSAHFVILRKRLIRLTEAEAYNWLLDSKYAEDLDVFADCTSTFFLLAKRSAISGGQELARFHNGLSMVRRSMRAVYVSSSEDSAARDIRLHFPEYSSLIAENDGANQTRRMSVPVIQPSLVHRAGLGFIANPLAALLEESDGTQKDRRMSEPLINPSGHEADLGVHFRPLNVPEVRLY
ncbi:hypothetical protein AAVH_14758 [Aphelenchoides avenae]|nr:hypothetical protein AAVH_14758 [Aphelenchus avenae]